MLIFRLTNSATKQNKRRKIDEAFINFQRLSSWLTRPETFAEDDQNVGNSETDSTPQLVDISNHATENSESTKNRSNASENADFCTIIVKSVNCSYSWFHTTLKTFS